MRDVVLALFALAGLVVFLGIIVWRVPEVPLIVVFGVVFLLAAYDFLLELRGRRNGER
jgi:uncharacterized membrane protein YfcA